MATLPNPVLSQAAGKKPSFFKGREAQIASINKYSPEAQGALGYLLNQAQQNMANPYQGFEPIAQQARSQFQKKTLPSIAERFAGSGSNALSSGSFASQLGEAGAGLEEALAALQSQYGMQNRQMSLQELLAGITPQFENFYQPREQGFNETGLLPLLEAIGHGAAAFGTGGASLPFTAARYGAGGGGTPDMSALMQWFKTKGFGA